MVKLPDDTALGALPEPARRPIASYTPPSMSGAIALGNALHDAGEEMLTADDQLDVAKAKADYLARDLSLRGQIATDQDYGTVENRYEEQARKNQAESSKLIRNGNLKQKFVISTDEDRSQGKAVVKTYATGLEGDANVAYATKVGDDMINKAMQTKDPAERAKIIDANNSLWDGIQAKGFRKPDQILAQKKAWAKNYAVADVRQRLNEASQAGDFTAVDALKKELEDARAAAALAAPPPAPGAGPGNDGNDPLSLIKREEGFAPQAKWDVRQYSGGYGSKAAPGETFTKEKADQYLKRDAQPSLDWVAQNAPNATPNQQAALVSFGYNLGTDDLDKLKPDIQAGNWQRVSDRMQSFNKSADGPGGSMRVNDGLVARRKREGALVLDAGTPLQTGGSAVADGQLTAPSTQKATINTATGQPVQVASIDPTKLPGDNVTSDAPAAAQPGMQQQAQAEPRKPHIYDLLDASDREELIKQTDTAKDAMVADQERARKLAKDKAQDVSDAREGEILKNVWSANPTITALDAANDSTLTREARERVIGIINKDATGEPPKQVSRQNTMNIMADIRRPDGDPQKITDLGPIDQAFIKDGKLTREDYQFLRNEVIQARTPEGNTLVKRKQDFINGYKSQITKSNPLMGNIDASGDANFYQFNIDVDKKMDEYREQKKNPYDLFDPSKPDFMGNPKVIAGYKKPLQQSLRDRAQGMLQPNLGSALTLPGAQETPSASPEAQPPAPAPAAPTDAAQPKVEMRLPNETPAEWRKRTGRN